MRNDMMKENRPMTRRYLVYPTAAARQFMCVCAARDAKHALKIARRMFRLERGAYARLESV